MHITIFANGKINSPDIDLAPNTMVIAADGGGRHCLRLGITPQVVIGDFDSLTEDESRRLEAGGAQLIRHPADKDETDLELALDYAQKYYAQKYCAQKSGTTQITLYGLLGGRWDLSFANVLLLASERYAQIDFRIIAGDTEMRILRGGETLKISGQPGDTVSAIPLGGPVQGLTYQGLKWPLENTSLPFGTPRGVSNTLVDQHATIALKEGLLLIVLTRHQLDFGD